MELFGLGSVAHAIHVVAERAAPAWKPMARAAEWMVTAIGSGMVDLTVGGLMIPVAGYVLGPAWRAVSRASATKI